MEKSIDKGQRKRQQRQASALNLLTHHRASHFLTPSPSRATVVPLWIRPRQFTVQQTPKPPDDFVARWTMQQRDSFFLSPQSRATTKKMITVLKAAPEFTEIVVRTSKQHVHHLKRKTRGTKVGRIQMPQAKLKSVSLLNSAQDIYSLSVSRNQLQLSLNGDNCT